MSTDPIYKLALQRAARLSIELEAELTNTVRSEPLLVVLHEAQDAAAKALVALVDVDAEDLKTIRALQNEVRRFDDLVTWLRQLLLAGPEAERELSDLAREEARALVMDEETAQQLGLPTEGAENDD